jgi:hypothetical protein
VSGHEHAQQDWHRSVAEIDIARATISGLFAPYGLATPSTSHVDDRTHEVLPSSLPGLFCAIAISAFVRRF